MRRLVHCLVVICLILGALVPPHAQTPVAITLEDDHFAIDGAPKFLIFVSYFDALRASDATWTTDLDYLSSAGIHGVRILPNWLQYCPSPAQPASDGVIGAGGAIDSGRLDRLKAFLGAARARGMVVDVTFTMETIAGSISVSQYTSAVQTVIAAIAAYDNAIIDVQNEWDIHGLTGPQIATLIQAVHSGDSDRRGTGSLSNVTPGGAASAGATAVNTGMDFSAVHDERSATWYQSGTISTLLSNVRSGLGSVQKPISFQEPQPWGLAPCGTQSQLDPTPGHFTTAVAAAKQYGAAAWTFHTRSAFDLSNNATLLGRLNADLNQKNELQGLSGSAAGQTWGVGAFTISPTTVSVDDRAGSGTLTLTRAGNSTGNWHASSNAAWLQVSASQGSGSSVGYSYSVRGGVGSRVGTITVAGKTVTVTQAGGAVAIAIDAPVSETPPKKVTTPFLVGGWAVDTASPTGTGVDRVDISVTPNAGAGTPIALGSATYGGSRPDIASYIGESRFQNSGYNFSVGALPPGTYLISVTARRTINGTFSAPQTRLVTVRKVPTDFDGDFASDMTVFRPSNGTWWVLKSSGGLNDQNNINGTWGINGDIPIPGDFDGDGKADMTVYRPSTGAWYVLKSSTNFDPQNPIGRIWGVPGDIPIAGDFDGDGLTDMTVYRPSTGGWYVMKSSGNFDIQNYIYHLWGIANDKPITGDFDGDGKSDMTVFRPSTGEWWILKSSGGLNDQDNIHHVWGFSTDIPLVGDFDGDGKSDMTILRPSSGEWYVLKSSGNLNDQDNYHVTWAVSGDIPIVGDYDFDGRSDMAVYRPSTGGWYILKSSGNFNILDYIYHLWGIGGDLPVYRTPY